MRTKLRLLHFGLRVSLVVLWWGCGGSASAATMNRISQMRAESSPIRIPGAGSAEPYPSRISLEEPMPGLMSNLTVRLYGVTHGAPDDINVLLVGPEGQQALLMANAGGTAGITNVDLTFTQFAPDTLPNSSRIGSGVYQPTAYLPVGAFPAPAPAGPYPSTLAGFDGRSPTGCWSLYVRDDSMGVTGSIAGGWSIEFTLPVFPPTITLNPLSQTVALGSTVQLSASASGTPPLHYQWRRGNADIPNANGTTYTIPSMSMALAGNYQVRVTNAFGQATSTVAALTAVMPPTISVQPVSQMSFVGATEVSFSVTAQGTPPLRYQWRKNGWNLPRETNATLRIQNVSLASGGTYRVVVANAAEAIVSAGAMLILTNFDFYAGLNNFNGLGTVLPSQPHLIVRGTNNSATKQLDEPKHGGKEGGRSVWYSWYFAQGGIATVQTLGSTFDTLLGVYTGTNVNSLTNVAGDEDGGLFYTSALRFNVQPFEVYHIAVDGFDGEQGHFLLSIDLEQTALRLPVITSAPSNQTVRVGGTAVFGVAATEAVLSYQWYFAPAFVRIPAPSQSMIANATNTQLRVGPVTASDVGRYWVVVQRGVRSITNYARLEIGPVPGLTSEDKFPDLFGERGPSLDEIPIHLTPCGPVSAAIRNTFLISGAPPITRILMALSVAEGVPLDFVFSTVNTAPGTNELDFYISDTSIWSPPFQLDDRTAARRVTVDTAGSTVSNTVVVYRMEEINRANVVTREVASDRGRRGPFGTAIVSFDAVQGEIYVAAVDAPQGRIHFNLHSSCSQAGVLSIIPLDATPDYVLLSWCAERETYHLQETVELLTPPFLNLWTNVAAVPFMAGEINYVPMQIPPPLKYFRLINGP